MKTKITILLVTVMALFVSCGPEEVDSFLEPQERPCYDDINEGLNVLWRDVSDEVALITRPDGGFNTLEECLAIRDIYLDYLDYLEEQQLIFNEFRDDLECSTFDLNSIETLYTTRIRAANERIDDYYSCE